MRSLAAFLAQSQPHIVAVCDIEPGDALALATRFALQWVYRGGQALFWRPQYEALKIVDAYLPFSPLRPFSRRGVVRVDVMIAGVAVRVFLTQIGSRRDARIRELRYLRETLRETQGPCILFAVAPPSRIHYGDLGFVRAGCPGVDGETVWARGFEIATARADRPHPGIGTPLLVWLNLAAHVT